MTCPPRGGCVACQHDLTAGSPIPTPNGALSKCSACGSLTCIPRPTSESLRALHNDPGYFHHPYFQKRRVNQPGLERRCHYAFRPVLAHMSQSLLRGERLLDIGCDTGAFLTTARQMYGIVPVGLDVSNKAVEQAQAGGLEAYASAIEEAPPHLRNFGVITALDVLEHVVDPASLLRGAWERLRPGGLLYVETPNVRSAIYRVGALWSRLTRHRPRTLLTRLFPAEHVQYFSDAGLRTLAVDCGFEVAFLGKRRLIWEDINTGPVIRIGIQALQVVDTVSGNEHLLCALLKRPSRHSDAHTRAV